jgi:hypothetical protein
MTQTVATTASTMSTAKPLLPEIALTMVTSLKATYSSPCLVPPTPAVGALTSRARLPSANCHTSTRVKLDGNRSNWRSPRCISAARRVH